MSKAVAYLRTHPVAIVAIVVAVAGIALLLLLPRQPSPAVSTPAPAPAVRAAGTPAPAPAAAPPGPQVTTPGAPAPAAAPAPVASPRSAAAAVDAGRPDPFAPLVRAAAPGTDRGGLPPLPPAPLPPPLFPGQQPPQPGALPSTPKEAGAAALVGILGDGGAVAIIRLGKETFIVSRGDLIKERIRVEVIDVDKRLVILEQDGEKFELKMGGVSGPHVAASASSGIS